MGSSRLSAVVEGGGSVVDVSELGDLMVEGVGTIDCGDGKVLESSEGSRVGLEYMNTSKHLSF